MMPSGIFFVGFMCSGKSTVGKMLAENLGYDFVDLDQLIEERQRKSIEEIFLDHGEECFRRLELLTLEELLERERVVVSTGGGLGANKDAMNKMKSSGLVIWLRIDFETFLKRCANSEGRPLLKRGLDYVRKLMEEREHTYRMAHLTLEGGKKPKEIVKEILKILPKL